MSIVKIPYGTVSFHCDIFDGVSDESENPGYYVVVIFVPDCQINLNVRFTHFSLQKNTEIKMFYFIYNTIRNIDNSPVSVHRLSPQKTLQCTDGSFFKISPMILTASLFDTVL